MSDPSNTNTPETTQQALKNSVFAAKEAQQNAANASKEHNPDEVVTREAYAKKAFNIEIPVDIIPLPTKGTVYPSNHPFHNLSEVEYRGMTVREEDILTSQALIKKGTVINELIRACLMDKSVDVTSLLAGDRNALMIAIRASGYGPIYKPSLTCPKCEHQNHLSVDLGTLGIKSLEIEPKIPGENLFEFVLPSSKHTVCFKFLTGSDEEEIVAQMNARKKKGIQISNIVSSRLMSSIVSVNETTDRAFIARYIDSMRAYDSSELRNYIDLHEPGVDMRIDFTCSQCDYYEEVALPMDASFFWPNAKR